MPPWLPQRCTTKPGLATPFLTCSNPLSVKIAKVLANGIFPDDAIPAPTKIIFCSAIPRDTVLSGLASLKRQDFVDLPKSASSTTTRGSSANRSSAEPYPSLEAPPVDGALMTTPPTLLLARYRSGLYHGMKDYPP